MLTVGIVLFIIGVLVAVLASGDVERLGYIVAVIGVGVIVLALVLNLADNGEGDLDLIAPLLTASLWKARLR